MGAVSSIISWAGAERPAAADASAVEQLMAALKESRDAARAGQTQRGVARSKKAVLASRLDAPSRVECPRSNGRGSCLRCMEGSGNPLDTADGLDRATL
jgi:hypothetical protein